MMTLAEKLRKLRIRHKMSMSEVARLSELSSDQRGRITQGYLSRLESGKETNPSLHKLLTICKLYDVEPNELLRESKTRKGTGPFSTRTVRGTTQGTEAGIRRIAESLARSSKHLPAIQSLLESSAGRQFLTLLCSLPEKSRAHFLQKVLSAWNTNPN